MTDNQGIERRIVMGLITSTDFIRQVQNVWDSSLLESVMAKRLAGWCFEYFEKYNKAPRKNIEGIYFQKLKEGLPPQIAEEIEDEILPDLSEQSKLKGINVDYLLTQTATHFQEKRLHKFSEEITYLLDKGQVEEAEKHAMDYKPFTRDSGNDLDLSHPISLQRVESAFTTVSQPVIRYPGALGRFINDELVRGAFVAFMASEKRGKTWWLLDMAMRAHRQKSRVAFFQAGDMTEDQQLRRVCMYLTKKSDKAKFTGEMYQPVMDCIRNQLDTCDKEERSCDFGVFVRMDENQVRKEITIKDLIQAYKDNPDYKPCRFCAEYETKPIGVPWLAKVVVDSPLKKEEAKEAINVFFIKSKRSFKLSTHPNRTLTIKKIKTILDLWEKRDEFIPDVIIIDYADLLVAQDNRSEFRHRQNEIWQDLRSLSQERHCLLITATQADAKSYEQDRLRQSNFSEDKRKYAHVTAMFGLNQDRKDREKKIGLLRLNKLVVREDEFSVNEEVFVLQNLRRGRPFLGSFF